MEGRRDAGRDLTRLGELSSPSLCTSIVRAVPSLSRMRFATPNGVSLTGTPRPGRCSAQESEGEKSKTGLKFFIDSDRPSPGRVRCAAPKPSPPSTAAGRSARFIAATGGSGGKTKAPPLWGAPLPFACDPPAVPRRLETATGRNSSSWATTTVSRPAGSLQFNLRGRLRAVPANGCLVPQRRGSNRQRVAKSKS